jgi:hypothetical protein
MEGISRVDPPSLLPFEESRGCRLALLGYLSMGRLRPSLRRGFSRVSAAIAAHCSSVYSSRCAIATSEMLAGYL